MLTRASIPTYMRKRLETRPCVNRKSRLVDSDIGSLQHLAENLPDKLDACVIVHCADHGIAANGVSALPNNYAAAAFIDLSEGLGIPFALGRCFDIDVLPLDCSLGCPTQDISLADAMSTREYLRCLRIGWNAVLSTSVSLVGIGELGAGGTTAAAALASVLLRLDPSGFVGHGSGISDQQIELKMGLVRKVVDRCAHIDSVTELMVRIGGKDIVSMVGSILAAYSTGRTVVLDGFITCVAGLLAEQIVPGISSSMLCCASTNEPGQVIVSGCLGLNPFMHIGHRCGMGLGCFFGIQACRGSSCLLKVKHEDAIA